MKKVILIVAMVSVMTSCGTKECEKECKVVTTDSTVVTSVGTEDSVFVSVDSLKTDTVSVK